MTSLPSARRIPTACKLQINILYYIYPCPVSEEPKESHFGGVWRSNPATMAIRSHQAIIISVVLLLLLLLFLFMELHRVIRDAL